MTDRPLTSCDNACLAAVAGAHGAMAGLWLCWPGRTRRRGPFASSADGARAPMRRTRLPSSSSIVAPSMILSTARGWDLGESAQPFSPAAPSAGWLLTGAAKTRAAASDAPTTTTRALKPLAQASPTCVSRADLRGGLRGGFRAGSMFCRWAHGLCGTGDLRHPNERQPTARNPPASMTWEKPVRGTTRFVAPRKTVVGRRRRVFRHRRVFRR